MIDEKPQWYDPWYLLAAIIIQLIISCWLAMLEIFDRDGKGSQEIIRNFKRMAKLSFVIINERKMEVRRSKLFL